MDLKRKGSRLTIDNQKVKISCYAQGKDKLLWFLKIHFPAPDKTLGLSQQKKQKTKKKTQSKLHVAPLQTMSTCFYSKYLLWDFKKLDIVQ